MFSTTTKLVSAATTLVSLSSMILPPLSLLSLAATLHLVFLHLFYTFLFTCTPPCRGCIHHNSSLTSSSSTTTTTHSVLLYKNYIEKNTCVKIRFVQTLLFICSKKNVMNICFIELKFTYNSNFVIPQFPKLLLVTIRPSVLR